MKILIISTNALGDTYLSAAALQPLRDSFPASEIHFLSEEKSRFLLEHLIVERRFYLSGRNIPLLIAMSRKISAEKYDIVLTFFPGLVNSFLFYMVKSPVKIGYINFFPMKEWYNRSQNIFAKGVRSQEIRWLPGMTFLERIALALSSLGIRDAEIRKPRFFPLEDRFERDEKKIVLHFKSRSPAKSLKAQCLADIVQDLTQSRRFDTVLIGAQDDFLELKSSVLTSKNCEIQTDLGLRDLMRMLLNCGLFIGVDSFPLHLADAHNTRFVGLFAPTNPSSALEHPEKSIKFAKPLLQDVTSQEILSALHGYLPKSEEKT